MSEVQKHGNVFEDKVIQALTGFSKSEYQTLLENKYTASMDITKDIHSDRNCSIKAVKGNGIGCADIIRFMTHCKETPFTMILGRWRQSSPTVKTFYEVIEFDITPDDYTKIWGNLTVEALTEFVSYIKSIPKHDIPAYKENQKIWPQKREQLAMTYGKGLAKIDAKVDSKTQRRVQCSLKVTELIEHGFPHRVFTENYNGLILPFSILGEPRKFT